MKGLPVSVAEKLGDQDAAFEVRDAERSDEQGRDEGQPGHRSEDGFRFWFWVCVKGTREGREGGCLWQTWRAGHDS